MAETDEYFQMRLRRRLRDFLSARTSVRRPLVDVMRTVQRSRWDAFIFGGVARDLIAGPRGSRPRDVDLVLATGSIEDVYAGMREHVKRRTRFGGLHLKVGRWMFDVWPAKETWAVKEFPVLFSSIDDLPKTTFFNVEAIVVEIGGPDIRCRTIYEHGFFEAMRRRTIEINFVENPFPALCVIRSFYLAKKLNFSVGPKLAGYLTNRWKSLDLDEVMEVQIHHYGEARIKRSMLDRMWRHVVEEHRRNPRSSITLPLDRHQQLLFWDFDTAPDYASP